eukprot:992842-Amorphochlora_amoeboformis.AAC.2
MGGYPGRKDTFFPGKSSIQPLGQVASALHMSYIPWIPRCDRMWVIWMLLGSATASEIEKIGSLIQCDVCRDVAAHLKHELESWRPLKITEASVRELVTQ